MNHILGSTGRTTAEYTSEAQPPFYLSKETTSSIEVMNVGMDVLNLAMSKTCGKVMKQMEPFLHTSDYR